MAKTKEAKQAATQAVNVSKEEQIGFHKGSLSTLAKEREEMLRILQIVEQLMQMHIKGLKDLGVDLEAAAKQAQKTQKLSNLKNSKGLGNSKNSQSKEKKPAKPIEDILR